MTHGALAKDWLALALEAITNCLRQLLSFSAETHSEPRRPKLSGPGPGLQYSLAFGETRQVPFRTVIAAFDYFASEYPTYTAVEHGGSSISYGNLLAQANALASRLRALGLGHGERVCLLVERGIPMITGTLAALKAGLSYIPLDGGVVTDMSLGTIIDDAKPVIVLCSKKYISRANGLSISALQLENEIVSLSADGCDPKSLPAHCQVNPSDEAYIVYTSGTFLDLWFYQHY